MTQEEKELLLKDLCGRLLYGVIVEATYKDEEGWKTEDRKFKGLYDDGQVYVDAVYTNIENVKPYLRPMSSMTKDEEKELGNYLSTEVFLSIDGLHSVLRAQRHTSNFLYSRHFDILGLIEKGLALEAPEDMYKLSEIL